MIYFLTPDHREAAGGVRVLYDYADTLTRAGIEASVWHGHAGLRRREYAPAPVVSGEALNLVRGDLLVVPEWKSDLWVSGTIGAPKVVLNQNQFFTLDGLPENVPLHHPYPPSQEVVAAIATSRAIDEFLQLLCPTLPTHFVPVSLDTDLFKPAVAKDDLIVWMPRKRPIELRLVTEVLRRSGNMAGWEFLAIDRLPPARVADLLGRARLFLLGNEREGLGLPGLEAMASGCQVIGFLGGGGMEYADYPLCTPVDDGDIVGMVKAAELAAHCSHQQSVQSVEETRALIERDHGRSMCEERMVEVFRELTADGSPALVQHPVAVQHFEYQRIQRQRSIRGRAGATLRRLGIRR